MSPPMADHKPKSDISLAGTFASSAFAACFAELCTIPLDTDAVTLPKYKGMLGTVATIAREEGLASLWKGIVPGLHRQCLFGGLRIGLYEPVKTLYVGDNFVGDVPLSKKVLAALTTGLLPNGDFEEGPKPSQLNGTEVMDRNAIPNWESSGFVEYIKSGTKQGDMLLIVPEGNFAVRLGNDASIKQKVRVVNGMFYSLTLSAGRTCGQEEKLNVSVWPNTEAKDWGMLPIQTMYGSDGWDSYSWGFLAEASELEIIIHNPELDKVDSACGPLVDSVALKALSTPQRTGVNMLKNGNFEEGPYMFPNASWGVLIPPNIEDDHSPLPGWMIESLKAVKYIDSDHFSVPVGRRAIELIAGRESAIAQVVKTEPGKLYSLTFAVGDASNSCEGSMVVEAFSGEVTAHIPYESKGKGGFKRAELRFTAVSPRTRVRFLSSFYTMKNDNSGSLCGPVIDDVKLLGVRNSLRG